MRRVDDLPIEVSSHLANFTRPSSIAFANQNAVRSQDRPPLAWQGAPLASQPNRDNLQRAVMSFRVTLSCARCLLSLSWGRKRHGSFRCQHEKGKRLLQVQSDSGVRVT